MFWERVVGMIRQGMTLEQIEAQLDRERRAELAALDREHRRRMWADIYIPLGVGMASLAWCVGVIANGGHEMMALASLPGVAWSQWKWADFGNMTDNRGGI